MLSPQAERICLIFRPASPLDSESVQKAFKIRVPIRSKLQSTDRVN